jgi:hypothetical protein
VELRITEKFPSKITSWRLQVRNGKLDGKEAREVRKTFETVLILKKRNPTKSEIMRETTVRG